MTELKPCPFCGSKHVTLLEDVWAHKHPAIVCECCLAAISNPPDKETLIEIWNNRSDENVTK